MSQLATYHLPFITSDMDYVDICFIRANRDIHTLAHEIGHILLNDFSPIHSPDLWNLLYEKGTSAGASPVGRKRLTQQQVNKMRDHSKLQ